LRAADAPDDPESRRKTEEEAERWRMGGGFMRGEVTVTRLGELILFCCIFGKMMGGQRRERRKESLS